jgi:hypothetical protein
MRPSRLEDRDDEHMTLASWKTRRNQYMIPFTASPFFDFLNAFLLGFQPDAFFSGSTLCIFDILYSFDSLVYFRNNVSDWTLNEWFGPVLNITQGIAGYPSSALVDCQ